jgi:hypothetical protein
VSIYEDHVTMPKARFLELLAEPGALHAEIARLTLLSDSQLSNQERVAQRIADLETTCAYQEAELADASLLKKKLAVLFDNSCYGDSLGVDGSSFTVCRWCGGGSGPGGNPGFKHNDGCLFDDDALEKKVADVWEEVPELEAELATERANQERLVGEKWIEIKEGCEMPPEGQCLVVMDGEARIIWTDGEGAFDAGRHVGRAKGMEITYWKPLDLPAPKDTPTEPTLEK